MEQEYQNPQEDILVSNTQVPPQPIKKNRSGLKWLLIVILLLLIAGVAGFFLTQSQTDEEDATPTPGFEETLPTETPEETATPKPVNKADISIEVQNGTGVAGEAGFLQKELQKLGYKDIKVGNAETQDATTTTATFSSSVSDEVKTEITTMLKSLYKSVEVKTSSTLKDSDILIVTGVRKGATATSTPKASTTPRPSTSPTATPRATATATPTATTTP